MTKHWKKILHSPQLYYTNLSVPDCNLREIHSCLILDVVLDLNWEPLLWFALVSRLFEGSLQHTFSEKYIKICVVSQCVCNCWDPPSESTGLWKLPIVSSVFKLCKDFRMFITFIKGPDKSALQKYDLLNSFIVLLSTQEASNQALI